MVNNKIFQVLCIKPFLFLWLAEVFSQIAFNMMNFILLIVVYKLTQSNMAVSAMVLTFTVPSIIFGLFAGVYVDRWNKKHVLLATNAVRAILLILVAIFHTNIFVLYILSFAIAITTQFFIPAETPMIPILVKKELLLSANALFGLGLYGSIFLAYALSGPFLLIFGQNYIFYVLALFFLLASVFVLVVKISKKTERELRESPGTDIAADLKKAFSIISKTHKIYSALFLLTLIQVIILILATIGPGYASQILGIRVDEFPFFIVTPLTLGMLIGAIIIGNYFDKHSKQVLANLGILVAGLTILALPYGSKVTSKAFVLTVNEFLPKFMSIDILHIMMVLSFILGFANALIFVPSNTILQEETENKFRGKVYGALNTLAGISSLFPIIIAGELGDIIGVGKVLTGIGLILLLIALTRLVLERNN